MSKWGLDCDFEKNLVLKIETAKNRWTKAKHDLEDAKYLERLIFNDYVSTIRNTKTAWDYRIPMIKAAQSETDKKKKKERESLSYIEHEIKETFFKDEDRFDIKIHNIISGGYEGYYWSLYFKVNNEEYSIYIPHREMLTAQNIECAHEGRFAFSHRISECSWSMEFYAYCEEEFAEKCRAYFDEVFAK